MKTVIDFLRKFVLYPVMIFATEMIFHMMTFDGQPDKYLLYCRLSAIAIGSLISLLLSLFKAKVRNVLSCIVLFVLTLYVCFVMVYYHIFHSFFLWNTIGLAGDVTAFYREAWQGTKDSAPMIRAAFVPLILWILLTIKNKAKYKIGERIALAVIVIAAAGALTWQVKTADNYKTYVRMQASPTDAYYQFGYVTSTSFDITQTLFGAPEDTSEVIVIPDLEQIGLTDVRVSEEKVILKNIVEMDTAALIAAAPNNTIKDLSTYFTSQSGSKQNDYTGIFEGKNLIFLTLEGFSYKAVSEELTPTLYKMMTEGFVFNNFYDTIWGGSTATGEYANITGNIYPSASCLPEAAGKFNYSAMGNLFKREGYSTYAFHNGYYYYYSRDESHPAFGYDVYKGVGNGLQLRNQLWPNSDEELAEASVQYFINSDKPFHVYYMTISGHTYYSWSGNVMARTHQNEVQGLNYSEGVKAYVATQIEVELCVKYLCNELEKAGKLEDTVFAMCADHYPYGLSDDELAELYGLPLSDVRGNLELYHNGFILWCASMEEPVIVDTPCSSYDILPTLANLFGCDYDSRFITGTDILAPEEKIVIINTGTHTGGMWNWITTEGTYHTYSKTFEKSDTCTLTDEQIEYYVAATTAKVDAMRKYSYALFDNDYYSYVFNKDGTAKYPLKQ